MIFGYLYNEKKRGGKNPKGNYDLPGPINNKSRLPMHRLVSPCPVYVGRVSQCGSSSW